MVENYPNSKDFIVDQPILDQMVWFIAFVLSVRQIRSEMNISPKIKISVLLQDVNNKDLELMEKSKIYFKSHSKAAKFLNENWEKIDEWLYSNKVQKSRKIFFYHDQ